MGFKDLSGFGKMTLVYWIIAIILLSCFYVFFYDVPPEPEHYLTKSEIENIDDPVLKRYFEDHEPMTKEDYDTLVKLLTITPIVAAILGYILFLGLLVRWTLWNAFWRDFWTGKQ